MKVFMGELSATKSKDTLVFCTQWLWSGDGARITRGLVTPGYSITTVLCHNIVVCTISA